MLLMMTGNSVRSAVLGRFGGRTSIFRSFGWVPDRTGPTTSATRASAWAINGSEIETTTGLRRAMPFGIEISICRE